LVKDPCIIKYINLQGDDKMTRAGARILNRKTIVIHIPTGTMISIDNTDIPVDQPPRTHIQQRDEALFMLSKQIGTGTEVLRKQCSFEFLVDWLSESALRRFQPLCI